ncbi:MAG TPA: SpoIIE family protein phosphatase [Verrucomicrobiota bacterium]|nr:SpoIIE family protein phosphatase [Verrucomicrobiota bacterium]
MEDRSVIPSKPLVRSCSAASLASFAPDEASRRVWIEHLETVSLVPGEVLFREGDPADAMFLVDSGELAVVLEVDGANRSEVRRLGTGQFLGEMALYRSEMRTATVEAVGKVTLWRLTAEKLREMECVHPRLATAWHRQVASLLAERVSFSNVELKEPLARLAHALRGLAVSDFAGEAWDRPGVTQAAERRDEVGSVAQAMVFLVGRLQSYLEELRTATAAREAIESELRIAGEIQLSLLPPPLKPEERNRVDFASFIKPAREAGGDLYDGFFLPDGRFFTLVGDVSGKGVPAAVFMALAATAVRTLARNMAEPGELLAQVNRLLCERNVTLQFVTACAAVLDPSTGELAWANAGHPLPALLSPEGKVEWLDGSRSPPLGVFEETTFPTQRRVLAPGETLLIYSDGLSEAMNAQSTMFGIEGIKACLAGGAMPDSAATVARLVSAVQSHQAEAPQADDITLVALRREV